MVASSVPRLALTPGEPAGIGPDIAIQLAQTSLPAELVVIASAKVLTERAEQLALPLSIVPYDRARAPQTHPPGEMVVFDIPLISSCTPGVLNSQHADYVLSTLNCAVTGCLDQAFAALITGPVHKGIINAAGVDFQGHTDYFADLCGVDRVVMMLATPDLRVALVTAHIPLAEVAKRIQHDDLMTVLRIVHRSLSEQYHIQAPQIYVAGLNPHAGEAGHLGHEEINIIGPVLAKLKAEGIHCIGPLPADTMFLPQHLQRADVMVVMYHDQGLPVLKALGFEQAVNVTLGLPFIRTSVGHGTAIDIAGSGRASAASLKMAVLHALQLINVNRR